MTDQHGRERPRRRRRRARRTAWAVAAAGALWLAVATVATLGGDVNAVAFGINAGAPFLAGLTLAAAALAAVTPPGRLGAFLLAGAGLLLAWPQADVLLARAPAVAGGGDIVLMTFSTMTRNADVDAIADAVREAKPDIAVMQEVADAAAVLARLSGIYGDMPVYSASDGAFLVVSRFPLGDGTQRHGTQRIVVHLPTGDTTIWSLHGPKDFWSPAAQRKTYDALYADIAATPGPRIVAGDFNASPRNDFYRIVAASLTDAHAVAGQGFGFTFPTRARRSGLLDPWLRIDYVFVSDDFAVVSAETRDNSGGSDHFPVVVHLQPKPD